MRANNNKKYGLFAFFALLPTVIALTAILPGCDGEKSYTRQIWDENYPAYQEICNLPFNREVAAGTLPEKKFRNYMIQDYFYLQNYKKTYEILLTKPPDERGRTFVVNAMEAIDQEIENVHALYFKKYSITDRELSDSSPSQTTETYSSYLMETAAREPFEVGLTATLPCNWIYYQVAADMKKSEPVENNPYQEWIDEYGGVSWEESDAKVFVDLVEYYMTNCGEERRRKMRQAYKRGVDFEYMFWDAAYNE
ncbi:MAG: TenA family protein [Kiritimatiellae bacterium]|jgi:thiaminase/transcriptional activator TenA|nr:TenA family protein [Kiritimatiellia bacterium]